jgi:hypothetical protein
MEFQSEFMRPPREPGAPCEMAHAGKVPVVEGHLAFPEMNTRDMCEDHLIRAVAMRGKMRARKASEDGRESERKTLAFAIEALRQGTNVDLSQSLSEGGTRVTLDAEGVWAVYRQIWAMLP